MRFSAEEITPSLEKVGFRVDHHFKPGEHHWGLIAIKQ